MKYLKTFETLTKQVTTGDGWYSKTKSLLQGNLVLNSYAKKLYSLFKKEGAKTTIHSTKGSLGDLTAYNVLIDTINIGYNLPDCIRVVISNVPDSMAMAKKYVPLVLNTFKDLELKSEPKQETTGWGPNDISVEFVLVPKKEATNVN
jgi:hypothetical protein